ncbi:hypothetical protein [Mycoavidus cysteinexigens]|uniref:hypothetical protein n=1 Tax=Mycoavidus cysteinexigens TaxID=1553431 RepID=UPI000F843D18|nr:hypothetical protein [Mycoavidus cysteinexigens]
MPDYSVRPQVVPVCVTTMYRKIVGMFSCAHYGFEENSDVGDALNVLRAERPREVMPPAAGAHRNNPIRLDAMLRE